MTLKGTKVVALQLLAESGGCVEKANPVYAARPWMRNIDCWRSQLRGELRVPLQCIDEAKTFSLSDMIQLVERIIVSLIVSHE